MANTISIRIEADGSAAIVGMNGVADAGENMGKSVEGSKSPMESSWGSMAKGVAVGTLLAKGFELVSEKVMQAGQYISDAANYAARIETLGVSMHAVGNNAGYTAAQMDAYAQGVAKMGITTEASRQSLTMMSAAQMDVTKAAELARVAQDAAVIGGINSSEAFSRMTQGIRSGEVEILRTIGINVNFEQSYKKTALELGKTTLALTEHEKVVARQNAVLEYGVNIQGVYEAAMDSTGKKVSSLQRYYDELKLSVGEAFSPALGVLIDATTSKLKGLLVWFGENRAAIAEFSQNMKDIMYAAMHPIDAVVKLAKSPFVSDEDRNQEAADNRAWRQEQAKIKLLAEGARIQKQDNARNAAEELAQKASQAAANKKSAAEEASNIYQLSLQGLRTEAEEASDIYQLALQGLRTASEEASDIYQLSLQGLRTAAEEASDIYQLALQDQEKEAQAISDRYQEILMLQRDLYRSSPWLGMQAGLSDYSAMVSDLGSQFNDFAYNSMRSMEDAFVKMAMTGKASFKDMANSIIADLVRIATRQSITGPLAAGLSSAIAGMFSGGNTIGQGASPGADGVSLSSAGYVWKGPEFATGTDYVSHDQIALIHRGEAIIPAAENKRGVSSAPVINIINNVSDQVAVKPSAPRLDMGQWVFDMVIQKLRADPGARAAMASGGNY
jgi:lambda family phage tail tape measure protein